MRFRRTSSGKLKRGVKPPKYQGYNKGMTVVIEVGKRKCKFLTSFPKDMDKGLAAPYPGYFFMKSFKNGSWDGHKHFITRAGYFPTGLLALVYHILTTGINPLIREGLKGHEVLRYPVAKVDIIVLDEMKEYFYPGLLQMWDDFDALQTLNPKDGTFAYPVALLNQWKSVEKDNPISKPVLSLCKSLLVK